MIYYCIWACDDTIHGHEAKWREEGSESFPQQLLQWPMYLSVDPQFSKVPYFPLPWDSAFWETFEI